MTESKELLPFSQELSITDKAHGVLHLAMIEATDLAFSTLNVEKDWQIVGLPIGSAALAGFPDLRSTTHYNFMDMTVGLEEQGADLGCKLFFHGHPRQHTSTATLNAVGNFDVVYDDAGDQIAIFDNSEAFTNPSKQNMFTYLFRLIGHYEIPPTVHDPDRPDFSTNVALEALMDNLFDNQFADSSTMTERHKYTSMIGSSFGTNPLLNAFEVNFVRRTTFRQGSRVQTLELSATESFDVAKTTLNRKHVYRFPVGEGPDSDDTSARLEIEAPYTTVPIPDEEIRPLLERSIMDSSQNFLPLMRRALGSIDKRVAESQLSD